MNPATDKEHYYIRSSNSGWVEAPDDVKNALKNPCAFKHPPPNSKCRPGEYENAPIQFEDAMINTVDNDFTAKVITRNRIVLGTDDRGADDVEEYNKNWAKKQEKNAEKRLVQKIKKNTDLEQNDAAAALLVARLLAVALARNDAMKHET